MTEQEIKYSTAFGSESTIKPDAEMNLGYVYTFDKGLVDKQSTRIKELEGILELAREALDNPMIFSRTEAKSILFTIDEALKQRNGV